MASVFTSKDFNLCYVPVPVNYPQSQTHAGVSLYNGRFFLVTTPYPALRYKLFVKYFRAVIYKCSFGFFCGGISGEKFENPMLYYGCRPCTPRTPPTIFIPYPNNPLIEKPDDIYGLPCFNCDPDILIKDSGETFILNREIIRLAYSEGGPGYRFRTVIDLIIGRINSKGKFELTDKRKLFASEEEDIISPCLVWLNNAYYLFYLQTSSYNSGDENAHIFFRKSYFLDTIMLGEKNEVKVASNCFIPWHMSIFSNNGNVYAVIACVKAGQRKRCYQMFGVFDEMLSKLYIYSRPLLDIPSYRGSACVDRRGEFILYSTTVHYKLNGSNSVDGRDVIMVHTPFKNLLKELNNFE